MSASRAVVTGDGTLLHVEIEGPDTAPLTVIFSHGFGDDLRTWRRQRAALAGSPARRVFYDQRAFGRSAPGPDVPPSVDQLARDLHEIIGATAAGGPVVLVGHSMGGLTVQALAAQAPELFGTQVVAVVLMAHPIRGDRLTLGLPPAAAQLVRAPVLALLRLAARHFRRTPYLPAYFARRAFARGTDRALWTDVAKRASANPPLVLVRYLRAVFDCDHTATLAELGRARTVVVLGRRDRLIAPDATRAVAEAVPGAELVELDRAGHMVHLEAPEQVNEILDDVITTALGPGRAKHKGRSA
ncbi:alpha/beta fold hydrolase [Amycolatopsis sp. A1MSW2902]|uniref:alpha/beta fold hydrolase n=1 Tax=Amycolatopsis sp. A1MSW2902 TaxID=687413 RepID=UPI00307E8E5F